MNEPGDTAGGDVVWWARARAEGPLPVRPGAPAPAGMLRLLEPGDDGSAWLVSSSPDGVSPAVLRDLRLTVPTLDHPNEASRVLAACLRCCWHDLSAAPWPGQPTSVRSLESVLVALLPTRSTEAHHRFVVEGLRQLHDAGWLLWDEPTGTVRLGPRVATWSTTDLDTLRELCRTLPASEAEAPA